MPAPRDSVNAEPGPHLEEPRHLRWPRLVLTERHESIWNRLLKQTFGDIELKRSIEIRKREVATQNQMK